MILGHPPHPAATTGERRTGDPKGLNCARCYIVIPLCSTPYVEYNPYEHSLMQGVTLRVSPVVARPVQVAGPRARHVRAYGISSNDIRNGMSIEIDGAPWRVMEFLHVKPGKGSAFVRTKLKVRPGRGAASSPIRSLSPLFSPTTSRLHHIHPHRSPRIHYKY